MMTVARDDDQPAVGQDAAADEAVVCAGLTYRFGEHVAVNDVDLEIRPGETFGLLGPNGAGKTTTIRMLTTLLKPAEGRVSVFGVDAAARPMLVGRLARTYSGGMIRRLELAQALINAPRLLVLDEPTVGLDPIARTDVWEYITNLRSSADMTVLMTTHYMDEADTYCDRIALMHQGRIRAEGTPAELKAALGAAVTLDDVFRYHTGDTLEVSSGGIRDVRRARRTARRLG